MNTQSKQRFVLLVLMSLCLPLSSSGDMVANISSNGHNAESSGHDGKPSILLGAISGPLGAIDGPLGAISGQMLYFHDRGVLLEERLDYTVPLKTLKNNSAICQPVGIKVSTLNAKSCSHLLANTDSTAVTKLPKFDAERGKAFFPAKASKPIFEIKSTVKDGADHSIALNEADKMQPLPDLAPANSGVWRVINLHSEECLTQSFTDEKDQAKIGQNGCGLESVRKTLSSQHL